MPRAITSSSIVIRVLWSGGLVRWLLPAAATPMNDIAPGTLRSTYEKSSAPIIGAGIACQPASPPRSPAITFITPAAPASFNATGTPSSIDRKTDGMGKRLFDGVDFG